MSPGCVLAHTHGGEGQEASLCPWHVGPYGDRLPQSLSTYMGHSGLLAFGGSWIWYPFLLGRKVPHQGMSFWRELWVCAVAMVCAGLAGISILAFFSVGERHTPKALKTESSLPPFCAEATKLYQEVSGLGSLRDVLPSGSKVEKLILLNHRIVQVGRHP